MIMTYRFQGLLDLLFSPRLQPKWASNNVLECTAHSCPYTLTLIYTIGRIFLHSSSASPLFGRSGYQSPIIRLAVLALPPDIKCLIAVKCLCIRDALNYFVSTSARFNRIPTLAKTKCFLANHSCITRYTYESCIHKYHV